MAGNSTESGRSVTSKITSILLTFTEGTEHSLTEIARLAGLPISTAHRLTTELASWRLLERTEDGLYRAGLPLRMIGTTDTCPPSIAERAPCVLEDLSAATKCRARLGVLRDHQVAYIQKEPGQPNHRQGATEPVRRGQGVRRVGAKAPQDRQLDGTRRGEGQQDPAERGRVGRHGGRGAEGGCRALPRLLLDVGDLEVA